MQSVEKKPILEISEASSGSDSGALAKEMPGLAALSQQGA